MLQTLHNTTKPYYGVCTLYGRHHGAASATALRLRLAQQSPARDFVWARRSFPFPMYHECMSNSQHRPAGGRRPTRSRRSTGRGSASSRDPPWGVRFSTDHDGSWSPWRTDWRARFDVRGDPLSPAVSTSTRFPEAGARVSEEVAGRRRYARGEECAGHGSAVLCALAVGQVRLLLWFGVTVGANCQPNLGSASGWHLMTNKTELFPHTGRVTFLIILRTGLGVCGNTPGSPSSSLPHTACPSSGLSTVSGLQ